MPRHHATLFAALSTALLVQLAVAATALAGPYEDAQAAYAKGDFATALKLYRPLAQRGDARAQEAIGAMYERGEGGLSKDGAEALHWYKMADDERKALKAYNDADYAAALRIFRPLADRGQILAEYLVGLMYANGQGVEQSFAETMKWHLKAANQGEAKAQFSVGVMYFKGLGTPTNHAEAFKWYRRAADQGDATAQFNLGAMYDKGEVVKRDPVTALMYYDLAAGRAIKGAISAKAQLMRSLSAAQVAAADKRVLAWRPKREQ
jgi:TPR repeat protein